MDLKIESVELTFAHNGVIVDFRGQNPEGDWCTRKEVFPTFVVAMDKVAQIWEARYSGTIFQGIDTNQ